MNNQTEHDETKQPENETIYLSQHWLNICGILSKTTSLIALKK
jgi:hypothetical protein